MRERFLTNLPSVTEKEQELLLAKTVFLAGCGGLGGYVADQLTRLGIGKLVFADPDCFEETNLNRQLLATEASLGRSKAEVAAEHCKSVRSELITEVHCCAVTEENAETLLEDAGIAVDALDSVESRRILFAACAKKGIPMVYGAANGWEARACLMPPGRDYLSVLYPAGTAGRGPAALACTASLCASLQVSLTLRALLGRDTEPGKLMLADLSSGEFYSVLLDRQK